MTSTKGCYKEVDGNLTCIYCGETIEKTDTCDCEKSESDTILRNQKRIAYNRIKELNKQLRTLKNTN